MERLEMLDLIFKLITTAAALFGLGMIWFQLRLSCLFHKYTNVY